MTSDRNLKEEHEDQVFYARLLPMFLLIALLAGIAAFGALLLTEGGDINMIGIIAAAGALVLAGASWARRLITAYPVYIRPGSLRVYGLRGGPLLDAHWFEWSDITRASRFHFPFFPCLVLRTRQSKRRYWIPLKLKDATRFRDLVNSYAGRAHPLTRALFGQ